MNVRIGIVTRNRAEILPKALASALIQDYVSKEIIVYDIASTDATPQVRGRFPAVLWRRSETRLEMIPPKNDLMRNTDAEFYFSLDDDAWFLAADQLTRGVNWMKENPAVAILAYDIVLPGTRIVKGSGELGKPVPANDFIACGALLRRSALERVGYYDESPDIYGGGEESDLSLKLIDAGYEIYRWPGLCIWHERAPGGRNAYEQHRSYVCNQLAYLVLRCPLPLLAVLMPWKIARHFLNSLNSHRLKSYCHGMFLFFKAMPALLRKREPVSRAAYRKYLSLNRSGAAA